MTPQSTIDAQARSIVRRFWDADDAEGTRDQSYDTLFSYLISAVENEPVAAADLSDIASEAINAAWRDEMEEQLDVIYGR